MANADRALILLESLIDGQVPTSDDIDGLLRDKVQEGLHLDYKSGKALNNDKKAGLIVRQYVSAFANSAGGILLIGINAPSDKPWEVDGIKKFGNRSLCEWVNHAIQSIAYYLTPPSRIYEVSHPKGSIIVIATARSASMVPSIEEGEPRYWLRSGDATYCPQHIFPSSSYLASDLLLGRRAWPLLDMLPPAFSQRDGDSNFGNDRDFQLTIRVFNEGLTCAEKVAIGFSAVGISGQMQTSNRGLLRELDLQKIPEGTEVFGQVASENMDLHPFQEYQLTFPLKLRYDRSMPILYIGLIASAKNLAPCWWELTACFIDCSTIEVRNFVRLHDRRPRVGCSV